MKKLTYSFVLVTFSLLMTVMVFHWGKQLFFGDMPSVNAHFSKNALMAGLVADTLRGLMVSALYIKTSYYHTSYAKAISFGLITSIIAGSLSVIYPFLSGQSGGFPFIIEEGTILLMQGLFSGVALRFAHLLATGKRINK